MDFEKVKIHVNDEEMQVIKGITLKKLLEFMDIDSKTIAIAIDGEIISPDEFDKFELSGGEKIMIVEVVQGG